MGESRARRRERVAYWMRITSLAKFYCFKGHKDKRTSVS